MKKSAFAAIVGRPSAGKSSLLNRMSGHKISIVAPVPQTTRNKVRGIVTRDEGQLVFLDTPGFHASDRKFNLYMKELVTSALDEVDLVLYVVDAARPTGDEERAVMELLKAFSGKTVIALNKIDAGRARTVQTEAMLAAEFPGTRIVKTSAVTGEGVDTLVGVLLEAAPEGDLLYPEEIYTDQDPEFRVSEIIREKAFLEVRQEVPHSLYVEVSDMEMREREQLLWIRAFITVERESQKGILVGKGGEKIREIRVSAQRELNEIFPYRVHLDLRVKVNPRWRRDDRLLRKLVR
jgi:GTP-binding protein Era